MSSIDPLPVNSQCPLMLRASGNRERYLKSGVLRPFDHSDILADAVPIFNEISACVSPESLIAARRRLAKPSGSVIFDKVRFEA